MSRFMNLLDGNKIDAYRGKIKESGTLDVNFKDLLSAAFTDILEKKSSLFRSMVEKGVEIDFSKSIGLPKEKISGKVEDFINSFKEDME